MDIATLLQDLFGQQPANQLASMGAVQQVGDHANPAPQGFAPQPAPSSASSGSDFLYSLLNSGQSRHAGVGGGMPQTVSAQQAPQQQPMPQTASQPAPQPVAQPSGGGIGGFISNLINPGSSGKNQTIDWLSKQGLDQGTATLLAGNKPALQSYLLQRTKGSGPTEFDQRAAAAQQYGLDTSTPEGRDFILTGKISTNEAPKPTSDIQNYQFAVKNGYTGDFATWAKDNKGGVNVNLPGSPNIGTIPPGYAAKQDPSTGAWSMEPIAGGPAEAKIAQDANTVASANEGKATATDVITGAAANIRNLSKEMGTTGLLGAVSSYNPYSDAAEVYRQVDVLKSNATVENLNAMREASKTGGALGNVTEKEGAMLAAKSGALDPKSPYFQDQLDDYERTLLRIVYGKEQGDKVFEQTRGDAAPKPATPSTPAGGADAKTAPQVGETRYGYRFTGGDPSVPSNWEKAN